MRNGLSMTGENMDKQIDRKKKILQVINDKHYKPLKQKELAFLLQVQPEDRDAFRQLLAELVEEGKVILTLSEITRIGMYTGNPKGFGFVTVEGEEEDYFIPESASFSAMHGDKVMIRVVKSPAGRRKEAEVIRIVEHGNSEIVGYFQKNKK